MIEIALVTPAFPPQKGGIQTVSLEMARSLGRNHQVGVIAPDASETVDEPYQRKSLRSQKPNLLLFSTIFLHLVRLRPQAIIVMHWHYAPPVMAYARLNRVPWILVGHATELATQRMGSLRQRLMSNCFQSATGVIVPSDYSRALLETAGVPTRHVEVVSWGVDHSKFKPIQRTASQNPSSPIRLLTVTSLDRTRKNVELVLEAIAMRLPGCHYTIVGEGKQRMTLEARVDELGIRERVRFAGRLRDDELAQCYADADLLVMPGNLESSRQGDVEGFGLVFLEAAACGTPSIAFDLGGVRGAIVDGASGILVPPESDGHFVEALEELCHDRIRLAALRESSTRVASSRTWEYVATVMEDMLANKFHGAPS